MNLNILYLDGAKKGGSWSGSNIIYDPDLIIVLPASPQDFLEIEIFGVRFQTSWKARRAVTQKFLDKVNKADKKKKRSLCFQFVFKYVFPTMTPRDFKRILTAIFKSGMHAGRKNVMRKVLNFV